MVYALNDVSSNPTGGFVALRKMFLKESRASLAISMRKSLMRAGAAPHAARSGTAQAV
jgi:hypothetical protein